MPFEKLISEQIISNGIFALLCVSLLFYTLSESRRREDFLMETLKEQGSKLSEITQILDRLFERIERIERMSEKK